MWTEAKQVFMHELMDKQNVVHPHKGRVFSLTKGGDFDTCYNVGEP